MDPPGFNGGVEVPSDMGAATLSAATMAEASPAAPVAEGDAELPAEVAYLPQANPSAGAAAVAAEPVAASAEPPAEPVAQPATAVAPVADADPVEPAIAPLPAKRPSAEQGNAVGAVETDKTPTLPATAALAAAPIRAQQKKGLFAALFSGGDGAPSTGRPVSSRSSEAASARQPVARPAGSPKPVIDEAAPPRAFIENTPPKAFIENGPAFTTAAPARQVIEMPSTKSNAVVMASASADNGLPGVRQSALFEIKRKSGLDDDSDVDLHEDEGDVGPVRMASAAGMARLAPNGLLTQTDEVDVACLKPSLLRVLKTVEQRYGRKAVVTSGYRSRMRNIRARGAKNSLHMFCAAADIQVPGVSRLELASYLRSMPGRGGVGTYCHTESVHVDIGPERDWNWRCRRGK
jgi:uncharacterized protein YcbK (DUF882 family)